jgi:flagellar motor switch protein FliG
MPEPALTGVQRAAILLMSLGEAEAAEVLRHMGAREVQKVGSAMATISNVSKDEAGAVLDEFVGAIDTQTSLGVGADDYVRKVLVNALGQDKAGGIIDRVLNGRNTRGLEALKWMEPRAVAELVRNEHPQIIAIVLAHLEPDQAAGVLGNIPEEVRGDVLMRIATLDGVQPSALAELDEIVERQFANQGGRAASVGGVKSAASILNFMGGGAEARVLEAITQADKDLGTRIQDLMFTFDDLGAVDDKGVQALLRDIPTDKLGLALKGAEPKVREKFTKNMSKRAAEMLAEDMEARGPVKLSDVEAAQKEILASARKLADAGTIQLGGKSEAYV